MTKPTIPLIAETRIDHGEPKLSPVEQVAERERQLRVRGRLILRDDAADFAHERHSGRTYGAEPYTWHLAAVENVLRDAGLGDDVELRAAAWLHDTVEDTLTTIDEIEERFGERVANLVWAVSGFGQSRAERNADVREKLEAAPEACVLKVADRIANAEASAHVPGKLAMYRREQAEFAAMVGPHVPAAMLERLARALA